MTDTTPDVPSGESSSLDRAAAAGPMDWDDRADTSSPPQDNADNSLASVDDADGHDHMSSIYGPPPELRHEPSGE